MEDHCFGLASKYAVSNICTNDGWDIDNTAMHIINRGSKSGLLLAVFLLL